MDDIKAILNGNAEGQVADNRGEEEWKGEYSGYRYHDLAGHIDGSIWCSSGNDQDGDFFENVDHTPRTQTEIKAYLESNGLDVAKTMAFFCGDSWASAKIAYWSQAVDLNTVKEWGNGWIPWSNEGNEFIDHNGKQVHYDKYQDAVLDKDGNDVSDGTNIRSDDATNQ
jgi:thiosulfate/3-mercaptopyruvate sulfurtransferase